MSKRTRHWQVIILRTVSSSSFSRSATASHDNGPAANTDVCGFIDQRIFQDPPLADESPDLRLVDSLPSKVARLGKSLSSWQAVSLEVRWRGRTVLSLPVLLISDIAPGEDTIRCLCPLPAKLLIDGAPASVPRSTSYAGHYY